MPEHERCGKMGPLSISVYDIIIDILDKKKYRNEMVDSVKPDVFTNGLKQIATMISVSC